MSGVVPIRDHLRQQGDAELDEREFVEKNTFIDWSRARRSTTLLRRVFSEPVLPLPHCAKSFHESLRYHRLHEATQCPTVVYVETPLAWPEYAAAADEVFHAGGVQIDTPMAWYAYEYAPPICEIFQQSSYKVADEKMNAPIAWLDHMREVTAAAFKPSQKQSACEAAKVRKSRTVGALWDKVHKRLEPAADPFCVMKSAPAAAA